MAFGGAGEASEVFQAEAAGEGLADLGAAVLAVEVRAEVGNGGVRKTDL